MSSNNNHTNNPLITRTNYEEYFVLYMDDELTAEEKAAVEAFLVANPDLQEEMDILLSTKLPEESISIDKSFLLSDSMKMNTVDDSLLSYIDNELTGEEEKEVEKKINTNPDYKLQHQLLLKAKLDPADKIVYPYKEELFRHTERRVVLAPWLRVAAAAVIVLGVSAVLWFSNNNTTQVPGDSFVNVKPEPAKKDNDIAPQITPVQEQQQIPTNTIAQVDEDKNPEPVKEKAIIVKEKNTNDVIAYTPTPAQQDAQDAVVIERGEKLTGTVDPKAVASNPRQQIINSIGVTTPIPPSLNITEAAHIDAVATNDKSKTVKGFLRKATRFIERNTNIDPTNDDNELLIGVVAIKLK